MEIGFGFAVGRQLRSALKLLIDSPESELSQVAEHFVHSGVDRTDIEPVRTESQKVTEGIDDRECVFGVFVLSHLFAKEVLKQFRGLKEGSFLPFNDHFVGQGEFHGFGEHCFQSFFDGVLVGQFFDILQTGQRYPSLFYLIPYLLNSIKKSS